MPCIHPDVVRFFEDTAGLELLIEMERSLSSPDATVAMMVDRILAHDEIPFLDLVQHFWRQGWDPAVVRDPRDADPLRYALAASILERMAEIWSAPPRNRPVAAPAWCAGVPAAPAPYSVIKPDLAGLWAGELGAPAFARRNIFAPREFMFFL